MSDIEAGKPFDQDSLPELVQDTDSQSVGPDITTNSNTLYTPSSISEFDNDSLSEDDATALDEKLSEHSIKKPSSRIWRLVGLVGATSVGVATLGWVTHEAIQKIEQEIGLPPSLQMTAVGLMVAGGTFALDKFKNEGLEDKPKIIGYVFGTLLTLASFSSFTQSLYDEDKTPPPNAGIENTIPSTQAVLDPQDLDNYILTPDETGDNRTIYTPISAAIEFGYVCETGDFNHIPADDAVAKKGDTLWGLTRPVFQGGIPKDIGNILVKMQDTDPLMVGDVVADVNGITCHSK